MLITYESKKSIEELRKALEANALEKNFGVMAVHDISKTLENKGFPLRYPCLILEICSPRFAQQVLEQNPEVSTALPCRIALYEYNSHRIVATLSPRKTIELFQAPGLHKVAEEVENILKEIMQKSV
ncbi:DUF302 domain-containing protein [Candidatus Methylacidiphilum infernorum]|uniref:DUF302 domain-containing protein n=1 Tax=Candidatus Methylacidiphilum infernorum TaxID=511746 RepID=A0ABX7PU07_9BACT|nr:DUF302 domain-containing protein [Candidatus Methylacidiphilum infernorum]QSR86475.1 DUF302 domain-containing protein [Candidatus Methylacidiphilum infernorum]